MLDNNILTILIILNKLYFIMHRAYLIKIYPSKEQINQINQHIGSCRWLYNQMITISQKVYHRKGKHLSKYEMQSYIPKLKKQYLWLKDTGSQSLQMTCHQVDSAFGKFFKKQGGFPNFKKKTHQGSFSAITNCSIQDKHIILPKIGKIKFRGGDKPNGESKRFTISKDATGFYCSILFDDNKELPTKQNITNIVGIDVGIKDFAVCSNSLVIKNKKFGNKEKQRLCKWQKALSRRQKGSKKKEQARIMVGKIQKKIANQRKDYAHKNSRLIINSCKSQAIALENLNIAGMLKNHKLAKSIADCGWYQFKQFLTYKAESVGKQIIEIDRFYPSSKICADCGFVNSNLTLKDRSWECPECKTKHNRDFNASQNIAMEGARIYYKSQTNCDGEDEINLSLVLKNIKNSSVCEADNSLLIAN